MDNKTDVRILIVEDEPFIAMDIADFLKEEGYVVQEVCYNAASALASIQSQQPTFCILDVHLGKGMDGISLGQQIQEQWGIPFIYLTSFTDNQTIARAKKTMPYGYISKPIQFPSLKSTLEIALNNFQNSQEPRPLTPENVNPYLVADLTTREFELLKDIYDGKTNAQLTAIHFISLSTVKTHVQRIYDKLDCHSRSEVIARIREILTT